MRDITRHGLSRDGNQDMTRLASPLLRQDKIKQPDEKSGWQGNKYNGGCHKIH